MTNAPVVDAVFQHARSTPSQRALVSCSYGEISYGELAAECTKITALLKALGIQETDFVGIVTDRPDVTSILILGTLCHCIVVPINPDYREAEINQLFLNLPLKGLLIPEGLQTPVNELARVRNVEILSYKNDGWSISIKNRFLKQDNAASALIPVASKGICLVLQTSGSTGLPKSVPLTDQNLLQACLNMRQSLLLSPDDLGLHMLPMFHIGGIVDLLLAPLSAGGAVLFSPGFDTEAIRRLLQSHKPTWMQTVPSVLQELVTGTTSSIDHQLRLIRSVSAPLSEILYWQAKEYFQVPVIEIYGMSETAGVLTSNPLDQEQKPLSVGLPVNTDISISSEGEVLVCGDNLMPGYLTPEGELDCTCFEDGYFRTGDLGYFDESGYLYLTGRSKDIINRGGEKVMPNELEALLRSLPEIEDVACFAVPDQRLGEEIGIALVIVDSAKNNDTPKSVFLLARELLNRQLAYFKQPAYAYLVPEIPRNRGKLERHHLADYFSNEQNLMALSAANEHEQRLGQSETRLQQELINLWQKILEEPDISLEDDFFYAGGDSLSATIMINQLRDKWGIQLTVSAIYEAPVLNEFAELVIAAFPEIDQQLG